MAMRIYVSSEEAAFFNNNKMGYADSIPTSGSYKVGDFIISSTQLDGIFGWVCTEEGTPGKWEVIGSGYALKSDLNITNNNVATATNTANTNKTNIGTMNNLNTSVKDNIVNAINEINTKLGDNTNLLINLYNDTLDYL